MARVKPEERKNQVHLENKKCRLHYNEKTGKFLYQPFDTKINKWMAIDELRIKGDYILLPNAGTIGDVRPFTDIIDALKLLFGHQEFSAKRVAALYEAFKGKSDLFRQHAGIFVRHT